MEFKFVKNFCRNEILLHGISTSRNGLEVAKAGQIANRWSIGSMVDGSMVDRSNSERLRGFCDRRTDGRTDRRTDGHLRF